MKLWLCFFRLQASFAKQQLSINTARLAPTCIATVTSTAAGNTGVRYPKLRAFEWREMADLAGKSLRNQHILMHRSGEVEREGRALIAWRLQQGGIRRAAASHAAGVGGHDRCLGGGEVAYADLAAADHEGGDYGGADMSGCNATPAIGRCHGVSRLNAAHLRSPSLGTESGTCGQSVPRMRAAQLILEASDAAIT
jgi:hypothetical protein